MGDENITNTTQNSDTKFEGKNTILDESGFSCSTPTFPDQPPEEADKQPGQPALKSAQTKSPI